MNKVYIVIDKNTENKYPVRSVHLTLRGALNASKQYQDEYKEDYLKSLVEIIWDEVQE